MTTKAQSLPRRLVDALVAISGWRLERLTIGWLAGGAASFAVAAVVADRNSVPLTVAYFIVTAAAYYGGNALLLGSAARKNAIDRLGEQEAWRRYERTVGLMFINQGLGLAAATSLVHPAARFESSALVAVGAVLFAVGFITKLWATLVIGVDAYFFKDMFFGRPVGTFTSSGPYRLLSHPMYTVGHLHAYGYALLHRSLSGLVAAAVCHVGLLAFYLMAERPFLARTYGR